MDFDEITPVIMISSHFIALAAGIYKGYYYATGGGTELTVIYPVVFGVIAGFLFGTVGEGVNPYIEDKVLYAIKWTSITAGFNFIEFIVGFFIIQILNDSPYWDTIIGVFSNFSKMML